MNKKTILFFLLGILYLLLAICFCKNDVEKIYKGQEAHNFTNEMIKLTNLISLKNNVEIIDNKEYIEFSLLKESILSNAKNTYNDINSFIKENNRQIFIQWFMIFIKMTLLNFGSLYCFYKAFLSIKKVKKC